MRKEKMRNTFRKSVSLLLSVSLLFSGAVSFRTYADTYEGDFFDEWYYEDDIIEEVTEDEDGEESIEEEEALIDVDDETGYITLEEEDAFFDDFGEANFYSAAAASTDSYDGKKYFPAARNQGVHNWCWAFSTIALAEASMVKQGKASAGTVDYSELGLAYFMYHSPSAADPLGLTAGDRNEIAAAGADFLSIGGNPVFSSMMLSGWEGVNDEKTVPTAGASSSTTVEADKAYIDAALLTEACYLDILNDPDGVKSAVRKYGGVTAECYGGTASIYKKDSKGRYCIWNHNGEKANHSVVIVGWDDAFPKESFGVKMASPSDAYTDIPSSDGAWLVRNSWGTSFGNSGYYWLSYEDESLGKTAVAMKFVPASTYDHNYHYDGTAGTSTNIYSSDGKTVGTLASGGSIGNIFESQSDFEEIRAVSLGIQTPGTKYSIQIYANTSKMQNPTDGEAMLSKPVTGTVNVSGIYCITLPQPVYVTKGTYFSVVAELTYSGTAIQIYTDKSINYTQGGSVYLRMVNENEEGQSFLKSKADSGWADLKKTRYSSWTFRIKAFTKEVAEKKIDPTGVTVNDMALEVGETKKLSYSIRPANASSQTGVSFASGDASVITVDNAGNVKALKQGKAEVTCTVTYPGGTVSGKCVVSAAQYPNRIYFKTEDITMKKGAQRTLSFSCDPVSSVTDGLTFTWKSDDTDVATVTGKADGMSATVKVKSTAQVGDWCVITVKCKERPALSADCYIEITSGGTSGGGGGSSGGGAVKKSVSTFSKNWYQTVDGSWKIKNQNGLDVVSAWLCDDAVTENGQNVWYLMNADGTMLSAGLVRDRTGNYYSLETEHNGYFGMLRYKNGNYKVNGTDVYIEFEQQHNGSFGAVKNQTAIDALTAAYGVTDFPVGNESCTYTSKF